MTTTDEITELAATLARLASTLADRDHSPEPAPDTRPAPERIMLTAEEAANRLGIGRTLMYRLIRNGDIESVRISRLRRIPASAVNDYAAQLINSTASNKAS